MQIVLALKVEECPNGERRHNWRARLPRITHFDDNGTILCQHFLEQWAKCAQPGYVLLACLVTVSFLCVQRERWRGEDQIDLSFVLVEGARSEQLVRFCAVHAPEVGAVCNTARSSPQKWIRHLLL